MTDELIVLNAAGPPSSIPLLAQQEEARIPRSLSQDDVWSVVAYVEIRKVALHATGLRAKMARLLIDARHETVPWWRMDDRNHMWFDFSNLRHDPYDEAKVTYARTLFQGVLPKGVKTVGIESAK